MKVIKSRSFLHEVSSAELELSGLRKKISNLIRDGHKKQAQSAWAQLKNLREIKNGRAVILIFPTCENGGIWYLQLLVRNQRWMKKEYGKTESFRDSELTEAQAHDLFNQWVRKYL